MSLPPHKHPYTPWIIGIAVIGSFLFAVYHLSDVLTPFIVAAALAYTHWSAKSKNSASTARARPCG